MHGTMYAVVMYLCLSHLYIICFPISITYYVLTLYHFQTAEPIIKTQDWQLSGHFDEIPMGLPPHAVWG